MIPMAMVQQLKQQRAEDRCCIGYDDSERGWALSVGGNRSTLGETIDSVDQTESAGVGVEAGAINAMVDSTAPQHKGGSMLLPVDPAQSVNLAFPCLSREKATMKSS